MPTYGDRRSMNDMSIFTNEQSLNLDEYNLPTSGISKKESPKVSFGRPTRPSTFKQLDEMASEDDYSFQSSDSNLQFDIHCGEPARSQHLRIDFTPIPGVDDTEELLQKCIDFWKFVESEPALRPLMVEPEDETLSEFLSKNEEIKETESKKATDRLEEGKKHQIKTMEETERERFTAEYPAIAMSAGLNLDAAGKIDVDTCLETTQTVRCPRETYNIKQLCSEMEEFDRKNPKTFDPPNNGPRLPRTILQRLPPVDCASVCAKAARAK